MSEAIKGVVKEVSEKPWEDIILYSFQIEGDRRYFRTGRVDPELTQGEAIGFVCTPKGKSNNVDAKSIEKIDKAEVAKAPPAATGGGDTQSRDGYWAAKEKRDIEVVEPRIVFSAAQSSAIQLISTGLANDAISLGNAKAADKLDILLDMVDQVTERFVSQRVQSTQETLAATVED